MATKEEDERKRQSLQRIVPSRRYRRRRVIRARP